MDGHGVQPYLEALLREVKPHALECLLADEPDEEDGPLMPAVRKDAVSWPAFSFFGKSTKPVEFWNVRPWETVFFPQQPVYQFPPEDLMISLIDLYFQHLNMIFPLLHRPTFDRLLAEDLHLDPGSKFGIVVILVCSVGSRFSDDSRVLLDGDQLHLSSEWRWYEPVLPFVFRFMAPLHHTTSLYDFQAICLFAMYSMGCSSPNAMCSQIGIGLRAAQDIGAHRMKPKDKQPDPVTNELLKRAWCFDVELPIDCDDEYWENPDPALAFRQPLNQPSKMTCFICLLQISDLMAVALRTLYCLNKTRRIYDSENPRWKENTLERLDDAMKGWAQRLPRHLRWDPNQPNRQFFAQSAQVYCAYNYLQILVRRPFLPTAGKQSELSSLSLAVCMNAARSCCHVVDICYRRTRLSMPFTQTMIFTAGVVLLLKTWAGVCAGLEVNVPERMDDVRKCLGALSRCDSQAGRFKDTLLGLTQQGLKPVPPEQPAAVLEDLLYQTDDSDELLRILADMEATYSSGSDPAYSSSESSEPQDDSPYSNRWMDPT
ncbi:hypothetical protein C8J56DRAFT_1064531 [Mycena floridula]|nr:hypothetical protein C8J56DRAFT_1064531 [Mycena floridula]